MLMWPALMLLLGLTLLAFMLLLLLMLLAIVLLELTLLADCHSGTHAPPPGGVSILAPVLFQWDLYGVQDQS
eukprot:1162103-Pelagomonas_calceolata.AAC.5